MNDKFVFYSKSANLKPGKGVGEYVNNPHAYIELSSIDNWRKKFSNMHIASFLLDGEEWMSVEHFFHACKFRGTPYYKTFTRYGGKHWSTNPFLAFMAGKAGRIMANGKPYKKNIEGHNVPQNISMRSDFYEDGIDKKVMELAQFAKFSQNPELKDILLKTNDAELVHLVTHRGKKSKHQLWTWLMEIRRCIKKYDRIYDLAKISNFEKNIVDKVLQ
jgi:predicted NAD-dependent protein-ADP-ribosyltransferase YbiA (DUF1768 family)